MVKLSRGDHWLRLTLLTPASFGAAGGTGAIDRPTVTDPYHKLPYVPDSVLKGVIAGWWGNVDEARPDRREHRQELFGSPDRSSSWGRPGPIVFGNGELLCFPVPTRSGETAWCVPGPNLAHLVRSLEPKSRASAELQHLARLEREAHSVVADPSLPRLDVAESVKLLRGSEDVEAYGDLVRAARGYCGAAIEPRTSVLIASGALCGALWKWATEVRTLTALVGEAKTVQHATLRKAELVPAGSVFVSRVTSLQGDLELDLGRPLQAGAWESQGLGWLVPSVLKAEEVASTSSQPSSPGPGRHVTEDRESPADTMVRMRQKVGELEGSSPRVRRAAKAAVSNLGPRIHQSGLLAAVAFAGAKARPAASKPTAEALANRWLLDGLLELGGNPLAEGSHYPQLTGFLGEDLSDLETAGSRSRILEEWSWLRRFAELALHRGAGVEEES